MTETFHPGVVKFEGMWDIRKEPDSPVFEDFLPFVNIGGVEPQKADSFVRLLRALHERSGENWLPRWCRTVGTVYRTAGEILKWERLLGKCHLNVQEYGDDLHYWIGITRQEITWVVDPWGVDENLIWNRVEGIRPYFGPMENCDGRGGGVYNNSRKRGKREPP